jgi:hypothetical protein
MGATKESEVSVMVLKSKSSAEVSINSEATEALASLEDLEVSGGSVRESKSKSLEAEY